MKLMENLWNRSLLLFTSALPLHLMLNVKSTWYARCRLGRARSVMHKLDKLWISKQIRPTVATKMRLLSQSQRVATYGSENWTYKMDLQWKIQAFELAGYHRILRVPWTQKKSNKWVFEQTGNDLVLLPNLNERKLT